MFLSIKPNNINKCANTKEEKKKPYNCREVRVGVFFFPFFLIKILSIYNVNIFTLLMALRSFTGPILLMI